MKSIAVGHVVGLGVIAGAGALAFRGLRKRSTAVRLAGTAGAAFGGYVVVILTSLATATQTTWLDQEIVRWNSSALTRKNTAWIKLGKVPNYQPPVEYTQLPFNLLRTQTPVDSPVRVQAIEQFMSQQPSVVAMMPRGMMFSRWRQGGGAFGSNVAGAVQALQSMDAPIARLQNVTDSRVPMRRERSVAADLNQTFPNTGQSYQNPVNRSVSQLPQLMPSQLGEYASYARDIEGGAAPMLRPAPPAVDGQDFTPDWDGERLRWIPRF